MTEGPLWLQYVVAFGTVAGCIEIHSAGGGPPRKPRSRACSAARSTIPGPFRDSLVGAAIFAGWAAWTARTTTKATRRLVDLEVARDERVATKELWRQARRVTVDLVSRRSEQSDSRTAEDVRVRVLNDSPDPIRRPRLGVVVDGEERWGPQLLPTIPPWSSASLTARIYASAKDLDAFVRFADVEGNYWLASARKDLGHDQRSTSEWIEAGKKWSSRTMSAEERGTVTPDIIELPFDFDEWLVSIKTAGEAWQPDLPPNSGET